jgi:hypothetical protein
VKDMINRRDAEDAEILNVFFNRRSGFSREQLHGYPRLNSRLKPLLQVFITIKNLCVLRASAVKKQVMSSCYES